MTVFFYKALLWLAIAVLRVVDTIFDLFKFLSGIDKVGFGQGDQTQDILSVFTGNAGVVKVFALIVLIGVGVGAVFTMISMSKNMVTGKKTQGKIFTQYFGSIMGMLIAFMVLILAIVAVSTVLGLVSSAFKVGRQVEGEESLSVGSEIITVIVNADDPSNPGQKLKINIHQENGHDVSISHVVDKIVGKFGPNTWTGWEDIDKGLQTGSEPLFPGGSNAIRAFPYFITLLCAGVLLWCSFSAVLSLIVRLFDIVFLQLAMPLSLACYPLDDGARFKLWRETMISKLVLAFGTIISVNVYLILINPIMKITLPNKAELENFFRILLVVCGGFTISAGQMLFARLMGTDASEGRQMQQNFRSAMGGLGTTWGLAKGAGRLAFGSKPSGGAGAAAAGGLAAAGTNIWGRRGGITGAVQGIGRGVGTFMFGNRYKAATGRMVDSLRGGLSSVKSGFNRGGGALGALKTARLENKMNKQAKAGNFDKMVSLQSKLDARKEKFSSANTYMDEKKRQADEASIQRVMVINPPKEKREV